ncbi:hypothetical protein VNI00_010444 [Paramarasmius palmivorus]|uniref:RFTS domain-containing protein n=1 Tax=Paramarasmius palmivorus TaxID=297713 RepID=A0AAW0CJC5_9AGAR
MPPSRVNKPSALDLSFGISSSQSPSASASGFDTNIRSTQSNSVNDRKASKRKATDHRQSATKKTKLSDTVSDTGFYCSPPYFLVAEESSNLVLEGEDSKSEDDEREGCDSGKPVRHLNNFTIFDTKNRDELVPLSILGEADDTDRKIEAAGYAKARFKNEVDEDEGHGGYDSETNPGLYLRLRNVIGFYMDYTTPNGLPYLETKAAWYILLAPSEQYWPLFRHFLVPHCLVQISISWALKNRVSTYDDFMTHLNTKTDPFGSPFEEEDMSEISGTMNQVLRNAILDLYGDDKDKADEIRATTLIRHWIPVSEVFTRCRKRNTGKPPQLLRGPDMAVHLADKQTLPHATPRIFNLAKEFFTAKIRCIGPVIRKPAGEEDLKRRQERAATEKLRSLIRRAHQSGSCTLDYRREDATKGKKFLRAVQINGTDYRAGDTVIVPIGVDEDAPKSRKAVSPPILPPPDTSEIVGKHISDFFCLETPPLVDNNIIPKRCYICDLEAEEDERKAINVVHEGDKQVGMSYNGIILHPYDFVLYRNPENGPACIGQVQELLLGSRVTQLVVKRLGRVALLAEDVLPEEACKDERHLFLTESTDIIDHTSILRTIYVCSAINVREAAREEWLSFAPEHFFLRYTFPSMDVTNWNKRRRVPPEKLDICTRCMTKRVEYFRSMKEFISQNAQRPLRALDIFGGVAAMGTGMEIGSRCIKVTHAIELSPSMARTYSKNSPDTKVFNQCANTVLRYIVRRRDKHTHDKDGNLIKKEVPFQLYDRDGKTQVPEPPDKGQIDVITASLSGHTNFDSNMYMSANDRNLSPLVPLLSFVDFYQPIYVFIEGSNHILEDEVKQGGPKLLIRALVDMGYQVRFAHVQAGHYGTPQHRILFVLIAAKMGSFLPDLPQPTHDFDMRGTLSVHLDFEKDIDAEESQQEDNENKRNRKKVSRRMIPIDTTRGVALHPAVSVKDAIGDLHMFDWWV